MSRRASRRTVLVLEDEPAIRRILTRLVQRLGGKVLEAGDGESAVELAHREAEPLGLIIADIRLPGLSGVDAVRQIRSIHSGMAVIFVSSSFAEFSSSQLMSAGGDRTRLVEKPFDIARLSRLIEQFLPAEDATE